MPTPHSLHDDDRDAVVGGKCKDVPVFSGGGPVQWMHDTRFGEFDIYIFFRYAKPNEPDA